MSRKLTDVTVPTETVTFASCSGSDFACYSGAALWPMPNIHYGGDNYLFCDGHVQFAVGLNRGDNWFKAVK